MNDWHRVVAWYCVRGGLAGVLAISGCGRSDLYPATGALQPVDGAPGAGGSGADGRPAADASADSGADAAADARPDRGGAGGSCGALIDDVENGSGRICEGPEGRRGVWYAFNSDAGTQWPQPTAPGVPITTSEIPDGGRGDSRRAMHTYGTAFGTWGAGIGFDVAFDGTTYGLYDGSGYSGVTFWARGAPLSQAYFRVSTSESTLPKYGGSCPSVNCGPLSVTITFYEDWTRYWVPFAELPGLERSKVTNMQFLASTTAPFDFWIDDVSFFTGGASCCPADCPGKVPVTDPVIDSDLHSAAGIDAAQPLACNDVCGVLNFYALGPAQNVQGLECLPALGALTVTQTQVSDIGPLASLARLTTLNLSLNQITDVGPLAPLTLVATLDLSLNRIVDVSPLASMVRLTSLNLASNKIVDIGPLSGLPLLKGTLDLTSNQIRDISDVSGLNGLTYLNLSMNQLAVVDVRAGLGQLATLVLDDNAATAIRPPFALPSLTSIRILRNRVSDVSGLAGAPKLQIVQMADNQMIDLGSFPSLGDLQQLDLSRNLLTSLSAMPFLPGLILLNVPQNRIVDLTGIHRLPSLGGLDITMNQVADLRPLASLSSLYNLGASQNQITDLGPLAGLQNLSMLDVSMNQVADLSPLAGHSKLTFVDVSQNRRRRSLAADGAWQPRRAARVRQPDRQPARPARADPGDPRRLAQPDCRSDLAAGHPFRRRVDRSRRLGPRDAGSQFEPDPRSLGVAVQRRRRRRHRPSPQRQPARLRRAGGQHQEAAPAREFRRDRLPLGIASRQPHSPAS